MDDREPGRAAAPAAPVTPPAPEVLAGWVRDDFGVEVASLRPVTDGRDVLAAVWCATAADGRRYALKWSRADMVPGLLLTAGLAADGVPGIPPPLPTRAGPPWTVRDGAQVSVTSWVDGPGGREAAMGPAQWRSFGALLARVHALDPAGTRIPPYEQLAMAERVAAAVDARVRRWRAAGGGGDDLTAAVVAEWTAAAGALAALFDRARDLEREVAGRPRAPVVCHADAHLVNVVVDHSGQVWLLDWDTAFVAWRECDLMYVIEGIFTDDPVTPEQTAAFLDGYGPVDVDPARLAYYRCTRTLDDLVTDAVNVLDQSRPAAERSRDLHTFRGIVAPGGNVTQALASHQRRT